MVNRFPATTTGGLELMLIPITVPAIVDAVIIMLELIMRVFLVKMLLALVVVI